MADRFEGTFEELRQRIERAGMAGDWQENGSKHTFRSTDGGELVAVNGHITNSGEAWCQR